MTLPPTQDLGHGITLIDSGMHRPGLAACYMMVSGEEAAFIETGTTHSVPGMLKALAAAGLTTEQVRYVIPTHVHLDHAGGVGLLMRECPNAELAIHPRGAAHMIDPAKLYAGATAVYGEATMQRVYGEIPPVDKDRVVVREDGSSLSFGDGRNLMFLDTPGHARHHFCVYDETSNGFFTGDTFGLSYREFDTDNGPFIMATTTPVQFDPEAWMNSLDRMLGYEPAVMYLTHYGKVEDVPALAARLKKDIQYHVSVARECHANDARHACIRERLMAHYLELLSLHGCRLPQEQIRKLLEMDIELNTQGLEVWLDRQQPTITG